MRSKSLDRRVRKEAIALVREARSALAIKAGLKGTAGDLTESTVAVEKALAAKDWQGVRKGLPALDSLVDELVKRPAKSTTRDFVESIAAAVLIAFALRAFVIEAFKIPSSSMYPTLEIGDHIFVNKFIYGVRIPWTQTKLFQFRAPRRGEVVVFQWPCNPDRDYIKRIVALPGDTVEVRCSVVYVNGKAIPRSLVSPERFYFDESSTSDKLYRGDKSEYADWTNVSAYRETVADGSYVVYQDPEQPAWDALYADPAASGGDLVSSHEHEFPESRVDTPTCEGQGESIKDIVQTLGRIEDTKVGAQTGPHACKQRYHYIVPAGHVFAMGDNRFNSNDSRAWGSVPVENIKGKALFLWLSYQHWSPFDWSGMRWNRIGNFVH